ncbi:MAG: glycosyltransferase family 4 protein [Elusimicrobia bacterium]|nr:glycosyltransferase family 4 protein [Elusimicrobiota bacterium]
MGKINSVLMLSQTFYPAIGGSEKQALELSRALAARGIKVVVLTRRIENAPPRETIDGVAVRRLRTLGSGAVDSIVFMIKSFFYLLKNAADYDVVHVHLASSPAVAASLASMVTGKRSVVKLGGGRGVDEITLSMKTLLGRLKLKFFQFAGPELLVMNNEVYNWLKNEPAFSGLKLRHFRNGVDTGKYSPLSYQEKISAKSALGFENFTIFLFVGRLSPEKRIKEFVETWAEVFLEERVKPRMRLVIVGKGPESENIRKAVNDLGVSETVTLAGARDDLKPYYGAADVFVLPSISEGLSNSMLEAMACGDAIMAGRVGGAREAVVEGVNGCLFDPQSRQEIKACIKKLMSDKTMPLKMGEKSREIAVNKYSMAKVTEELLKIYEEA